METRAFPFGNGSLPVWNSLNSLFPPTTNYQPPTLRPAHITPLLHYFITQNL
ncbi:MAG: hypothetical protein ACOC2E_09395 [Bacteroidota bacterium]